MTWTSLIASGYGLNAGFCEHGNYFSASAECWESYKYLSNWQFRRKNSYMKLVLMVIIIVTAIHVHLIRTRYFSLYFNFFCGIVSTLKSMGILVNASVGKWIWCLLFTA
jgi:hypothetical protein